MIRKNPLSWNIRQICTMIEKGTIVFDNPNQRPPGQWDSKDNKAKSLLVDSIFRMFIPDIIAIQKKREIGGKEVNVYDIIDGQQRLEILPSYRKDMWALCDLKPIKLDSTGEIYDISGLKYSELPQEVQDEIDSFTLTIRPLEVEEEEGETDEDVASMVTYRLNNGKPMTREHLALLALPEKSKRYVQAKVREHKLFKDIAHFSNTSIKSSGREMSVMQSIVIAGKYDYESFVTKHVEAALEKIDIEDEVFEKVDRAFDIISNVFDKRNKFISKVNIPSFVYLLLNNNFDERVVSFLCEYEKTNKKADPYRRYAGGTKKSDVEGRFRGLQALFEEYTKGIIVDRDGQALIAVQEG